MASLQFGPLTSSCVHLCVDMQKLFGKGLDWETPWLDKVLPTIERLASARPDRTIFTRFIPAPSPGEGVGTWRRYYERWPRMTLERLPPGSLDLLPSLARLVPPGEVIDKTTYSPWLEPALPQALQRRGADTVIVTGTETDVCVLATVLGAVDLGYRVVLSRDAICSSSDRTHDALLTLYHERFGQQVEVTDTDELLASWS